MNSYENLIARLDAFIRKYYVNQLLRGLLVFLACLLIYVLVIGVGEYFLYFPSWLKIIIVAVLLGAGLFAFVWWVVIPFLKMQKLGKVIARDQAAKIVGMHFPEVKDKLLNVLQLHQSASAGSDNGLLFAAIDQKTKDISVVPFAKAVDLSKNKKYLPYVIPPALIILGILLASPNVFRDASRRLIQADKNFTPPAPFEFRVTNKDFKVALYDNYTLNVTMAGKQLPQNVFVIADGEEIEMQRVDKNHFTYTFRHVAKEIAFRLSAAGYYSQDYKLSIIQKPQLEGFRVWIQYPEYTGKENEELQGISDLSVPQGTIVKWEIRAKNTDNVSFALGDGAGSTLNVAGKDDDVKRYTTQYRFIKDTAYTFTISNKQVTKTDSFSYRVQVMPDLSPQVSLQEMKDSISGQQVVLTGTASDDYGISNMYFHYALLDEQQRTIAQKNIPLKTAGGTVSPYQYYFDFGTLNVLPGQQVNYYIEAWDNDAINGSKSARSAVMTYKPFGGKSVDSAIEQTADQIAKGLNSTATQAEKMQEEMKDLKEELLQSESMSWEQQEKMKSMMDKQLNLKSRVEAIRKRFEQQQQQTAEKNYSEEIKKKEEAIEKQLDNLANKELQEQLRKLQEMMQKMNMSKENAFQNLQQMERENKLFNMDMERIQELMKQLEMQMKLEDMSNKLEQIAKKQAELQDRTNKQSQNNQQLHKEQQDIKNQMDQMMSKDMKELDRLNKEQSGRNEQQLGDLKEEGDQAGDNMQNSSDQLQQNNSSKSSQSQQKAQQNMQKMLSMMRQMAAGMDMKQLDIDIKATRQILTNLIRFSFGQEALMKKVKQTPPSSPVYVQNAQEQKRLSNNADMIRDSLFVLSKRLFELGPTINKETTDLTAAIEDALRAMEGRNIPTTVTEQQYAMTSANNLALLLNETLANLMAMQMQAMKGQGQGQPSSGQPSPGSGSPGAAGQMMKDIITGQQQMGQGLGKMGQGRQGRDGGQPGQQGQNGGGGEGEAEQIARMAQQQAALRRQIQELNSMLNSKGMGGNAQLMKEIQEKMDRMETDLVNRRNSGQLVERQKDIMTRLLQAEKAIREQEEDNKRSAIAGKDEQRPMPPELQQYLQSRQALLDLYKTTPPALKPYYKKMAEEYLNKVKQ